MIHPDLEVGDAFLALPTAAEVANDLAEHSGVAGADKATAGRLQLQGEGSGDLFLEFLVVSVEIRALRGEQLAPFLQGSA